MKNPYIFSDSNKRYQTLDYYFKQKYGQKIFKVSLNGGFSCPNRDGKISKGGCIYCSNSGSGEYAGDISKTLLDQYKDGFIEMQKKWPNGQGIAYFQAFTNTYGSLEKLHSCFDQFINLENCIGLDIATRPDCLSEDILNYLDELNKKTDLYIELGLQTSNDDTAKLINRGYNYDVFLQAIRKLNQLNIKTVVHIINGLPNETKEDMINTIKDISKLDIFGIKFHCLNILKNTTLEKIHKELNLHILTKEEYLNIVSEQLEFLSPNMVIERINTDAKRSELIAPLWNEKKVSVSNDLDKMMIKNDRYQGKNYKKSTNYLQFCHNLCKFNTKYDIAVDATLGNGYDSLFLTNYYNKVYSFDIQDLAFKRSIPKFNKYKNISFIKDSYENICKHIKEEIDCIVYNLGFLPGSDHSVKTDYNKTINSLKHTLPLLSKNGKCIIVSYTIHDNGEEYSKLIEYLATQRIVYNYVVYNFGNNKVIEIKKAID